MSYQDLLSALLGNACTGVEEDDVEEMLHALSQRRKTALQYEKVLYERYVERKTLKEVSEGLGVVKERVRQLEAKALLRMRCILLERYEGFTYTMLFKKESIINQGKLLEEVQRTEMSTEDEQWLTGFWEGDGYVGTLTDVRRPRTYSVVSASQKDRSVLDFVRSITYGAGLSYSKSNNAWMLQFGSDIARRLVLGTFSKYVVSKYFLKKLNTMLELCKMSQVAVHEPTIDWLAGFFDAEGSVAKGAYTLAIGQKELYVLEAIQRVFGGKLYTQKQTHGHNDLNVWSICRRDGSLELTGQLRERSHHTGKKAQLESLLTRVYIKEHSL